MKKFVSLFVLVLLFQVSEARTLRRASDNTSAMDRVWKYRDQTVAVEGHFLMAKNGEVFISSHDEVHSFFIHNLHWVDRKYVSSRMKKMESLDKWHQENTLAENPIEASEVYQSRVQFSWYTQALLVFTVSGSCFLLAWTFRSKLKRQLRLAVAFLMIMSTLIAIDRHEDDVKPKNINPGNSTAIESEINYNEIAFLPSYSNR